MTLSELLKQEPRPELIQRPGWAMKKSVQVSFGMDQFHYMVYGPNGWVSVDGSFRPSDILADDWEPVREPQ